MWHMNIDHNDGNDFILGHRNYIERLETFLANNGGGDFVPLPKWNPASPIPREFLVMRRGPRVLDVTLTAPRMPLPPQFAFPNVCRFRSVRELGDAIRRWHNNVHSALGGPMGDLMTAPACPLFFCWHAFIDDVYADWLTCRSNPACGSGCLSKCPAGN
jgi:hypothetical protein